MFTSNISTQKRKPARKFVIATCVVTTILTCSGLTLADNYPKGYYEHEVPTQKIKIEEVALPPEMEPTPTTAPTPKPIPTPAPTPTPKPVAFKLSDYERQVLINIVSGEAGYDGYESQWAVATCLYNACKRDGLQPSQVRKRYQYAGWKTNLKSESPKAYNNVVKAVSTVFDDGYRITNEPILWFYAPKYCRGTFHNTQKYVGTWGTQKFYAPWK